jgi:hypothetical protein
MKLPFCKFVFKIFIFSTLPFPAKLKRSAGKAKKNRGVRPRANTMHGIAACARTPLYVLDSGVGWTARHR